MYLLRCPQCHGCIRVEDDVDKGWCRKCLMWVGAVERHVVHDPAEIRQHVLKGLQPIAEVMRPFGFCQTLLAVGYFVVVLFFGSGRLELYPESLAMIAIVSVVLVGGVLITAGGVAVQRGRGRLFALVGGWFALTSPLLVGIPLGVWVLMTLHRPEVRAAFGTPVASGS